jgi:hypothetical protein
LDLSRFTASGVILIAILVCIHFGNKTTLKRA